MPSDCEAAGGTTAGAAAAGAKRARNVLNSSSVYSSRNRAVSGSARFNESKSMSMGTSVQMVTRRLARRMLSAFSVTFFFSPGFRESALAIRFSTEPYWRTRIGAVFLPMPGQPGILSALSPSRASKSITCKVLSISYRLHTSATPRISPSSPRNEGRYMKILSVTSWP